jgi:hypothetical protein
MPALLQCSNPVTHGVCVAGADVCDFLDCPPGVAHCGGALELNQCYAKQRPSADKTVKHHATASAGPLQVCRGGAGPGALHSVLNMVTWFPWVMDSVNDKSVQ